MYTVIHIHLISLFSLHDSFLKEWLDLIFITFFKRMVGFEIDSNLLSNSYKQVKMGYFCCLFIPIIHVSGEFVNKQIWQYQS